MAAQEENKVEEIDTTNDQFISVRSKSIGKSKVAVVIMSPKIAMTKEEAIRHAAWLVILAGEYKVRTV